MIKILYDPTRRWTLRASCRSVDPERFFVAGTDPAKPPSPAAKAAWDEVKKICSFCPVLEECRRDTLGEQYGVWGGRDERQRYLLRTKMHKRAAKWPQEERIAWSREIAKLHNGGLTWIAIQRMTGIPEALGKELLAEWRERQRPAQPRAQVVDLPLPEPLSFPPGPGRRHCWARSNGLVADAHYKGETEDGQWVFVQLRGSRGNSMKWIKRQDVQIYHPQPVVILKRIGRPSSAQRAQAG